MFIATYRLPVGASSFTLSLWSGSALANPLEREYAFEILPLGWGLLVLAVIALTALWRSAQVPAASETKNIPVSAGKWSLHLGSTLAILFVGFSAGSSFQFHCGPSIANFLAEWLNERGQQIGQIFALLITMSIFVGILYLPECLRCCRRQMVRYQEKRKLTRAFVSKETS